jgi:hypothetical protein
LLPALFAASVLVDEKVLATIADKIKGRRSGLVARLSSE